MGYDFKGKPNQGQKTPSRFPQRMKQGVSNRNYTITLKTTRTDLTACQWNQTIVELQKEHEKALKSTVNILRELHLPEHEIVTRICEQYRIDEKQLQKYL